MTDLFILDDENNPVPMQEEDLIPWGNWLEEGKVSGRIVVGDTSVGRFHVRTVFGGCDSNWDDGPPLLFDSRVTENGERRDLFMRRYATWTRAQTGHDEVCSELQKQL